jgi:hypothetical protein
MHGGGDGIEAATRFRKSSKARRARPYSGTPAEWAWRASYRNGASRFIAPGGKRAGSSSNVPSPIIFRSSPLSKNWEPGRARSPSSISAAARAEAALRRQGAHRLHRAGGARGARAARSADYPKMSAGRPDQETQGDVGAAGGRRGNRIQRRDRRRIAACSRACAMTA